MRVKMHLDKALIKGVTKAAARKGLFMACDHLAAVSKNQVPIDSSALKSSCAVSVSDDGTQAVVSYDTPYAVRQHEELSYRHRNGRKAKYLEDPANDGAVQGAMRDLLAGAFREAMS